VLDDRLPESNPKSVLFTELKGVAHTPVGIRDYTGTLMGNIETDANGYFEALVPASRNSGNFVASAFTLGAGMYCITSNDPGTPTNPAVVPPLKNYRPIRACFESMPGRIVPVDLAPVALTPSLLANGGDVVDFVRVSISRILLTKEKLCSFFFSLCCCSLLPAAVQVAHRQT